MEAGASLGGCVEWTRGAAYNSESMRADYQERSIRPVQSEPGSRLASASHRRTAPRFRASARRTWLALGLTLAWATFTSVEAPAVHLRGRIVQVGYPATGPEPHAQGQQRYRLGCWLPILVELTNDDGDVFAGTIEVDQRDVDGDRATVRRDVVVRGVSRFFLYIPSGSWRPEASTFAVRVRDAQGRPARLIDDQGRRIKRLIPPAIPRPWPDDVKVILDISDRPVTALRALAQDAGRVQPVAVARSTPTDVPDHAAGLAMADVIVWDEPDPRALDVAPMAGLLAWVRQGGTLVLGVGSTWQAVARSKLAAILPARLGRPGARSLSRQGWEVWLGDNELPSAPDALDAELPGCGVADRDLHPQARVVWAPGATGDGRRGGGTASSGEGPSARLVTARPIGRGQVILVTARLADLLAASATPVVLMEHLLALRQEGAPAESAVGGYRTGDLSALLRGRTAFSVTKRTYLLIAFAFVTVYIGLVGVASWFWLKRRGATQHAWAVFALGAFVAALVSLLAVGGLRGLGTPIQTLTVVDGRAYEDEVTGHSFFGVRSARHVELDLALAGPDASRLNGPADRLMPIMPQRHPLEGFAVPRRYEVACEAGQIRGVPIRGTLKQCRGEWAVTTAGRLTADLRRQRAGTVRLAATSWIENQLGTDLYDCWLFVTNQDPRRTLAHRDLAITGYRLGELKAGERRGWSKPPAGARLATLQERWLRSSLLAVGVSDGSVTPRPADAGTWPKEAPERFLGGVLLLTLFQELDRNRWRGEGWGIHAGSAGRLDRSDAVRCDQALFVGFSREPGPVALAMRRAGEGSRPFDVPWPVRSDVVWRVVIPLRSP